MARIFAVKDRPTGPPADRPHRPGVARRLGRATCRRRRRRSPRRCWPGPLTLLLPRSASVPDAVTGGRDTVGLRAPAHPLTQRLLAITGLGIAAPSANRFGRVSPTTARHVLDDLGRVPRPGPRRGPRRRPEPDRRREHDRRLHDRPAAAAAARRHPDRGRRAPPRPRARRGSPGPSRAAGMLASHYAPRARVVLVPDRAAADGQAAGARAGTGCAGRSCSTTAPTSSPTPATSTPTCAPPTTPGADRIVAVLPPPVGLGHAIRDRLAQGQRASEPPSPTAGSPRSGTPGRVAVAVERRADPGVADDVDVGHRRRRRSRRA